MILVEFSTRWSYYRLTVGIFDVIYTEILSVLFLNLGSEQAQIIVYRCSALGWIQNCTNNQSLSSQKFQLFSMVLHNRIL